MSYVYQPELLYSNGAFLRGASLVVDDRGRIEQIVDASSSISAAHTLISLPGRALLPGFVNAHSHAFQRLIRGKAESRALSGKDFWSWRRTMYHAACAVSPEQMYRAARMVFLEMVMAGITTVGEFHYVHNQPEGKAYPDANTLARQVMAAARSVGIRIVLLRSAYQRAGFRLQPESGQRRFYEATSAYLKSVEALLAETSDTVGLGLAPHSIRALPLTEIKTIAAWARERGLPIHMHMAEQIAENEASLREYGATPVALLAREHLLGPDWTAIHAIHLREEEFAMLADSGAAICSCPTTERNLGDGIFAAEVAMRQRIPIALGSDSQAQIDPLEDARQLDYHLRLLQQERAVLDQLDGVPIEQRLFAASTVGGAAALQVAAGEILPGRVADFFTVALSDLSIAGHGDADLLARIVFGMNRTALRDVAVQGKLIVRDGKHLLHAEIVREYEQTHQEVWSGGK